VAESRLPALTRALILAVLTALLGTPTVARAAGGAPAHSDVYDWAAAWNSHDINTVLQLFSKDVSIDQPENSHPLTYSGARGFFTMIFRAYPDFHVSVRQAFVDGQTAVSVEQVTGTWLGPFIDPRTGKRTPPNGKHFDHPGVMILTYDSHHKIRHVSIYWDQLTVDRQLDIKP
jgi:steroid delta-isomerase-like uncharacterized protein